jgi:hypothetical protein
MKKTYTIEELMSLHDAFPGQLKVRREAWGDGVWFSPYYQDKTTAYWHGLDEASCTCITDILEGWSIYKEPPKKKKLVKHWLCYHTNDNNYIHSQMLSQEAIDAYIPQTLVKIPGTEVEIEVDE